jgi:ferredoxin-type protein NapH
VGLAANYAATLPAWGTAPFLLAGILLLAGGLAGTLVCGWACPFGFLQDLLARGVPYKMSLPSWMGEIRYGVLCGLVLFLPWYFGQKGVLFDMQPVSICRLCPAGALEAGLYYSLASLIAGNGWIMSWYKAVILVAFVGSALIINRPWCRIFCPLGGFLALFNKVSVFHLRFKKTGCSECNSCRSRCSFDVKLDLDANARDCVRCLECVSCDAIEPVVLHRRHHAD